MRPVHGTAKALFQLMTCYEHFLAQDNRTKRRRLVLLTKALIMQDRESN
jgi:hypothetical protein